MTVSTTNRRAGPFPGAGTVGPFSFNFYMPAPEYVVAVLADPDGIESTLAYETDFSVVLNADQSEQPGGELTLVNNLGVGYSLTITSNVPSLQPTDITNLSGFYQRLVTVSLDRLTVLVQQLEERVGRAFVAPISGGADITELLAQLAAQLQYVQAVYAQLDAVKAVADDIGDVQSVVAHIDPIRAIAADMAGSWQTGVVYDFGSVTEPAAGGTTDAVGNIVTVAGHIANVDTVATKIADVNTVSLHILAVDTVAADIASVNSVVANQVNIDAVAANEANIDTVAASEVAINTVAASDADVNTVAANVADVNTVAGISPKVTTVADNKTAVVALGNDLTGLPVSVDYGAITDPANNPVSPGGVLGAVYANAADITTAAANIAAILNVSANMAAILAALSGALTPANNLSDVANVATARANLGLADLGGIV